MARQDLRAVMTRTEQLMLETVDSELLRGESSPSPVEVPVGVTGLAGGPSVRSRCRQDNEFHLIKMMETKL